MNRYEQRRRRVLDQLQFGEMMVLYSGESVACSMDEGFDFEANHHFFYLTGLRRENMALRAGEYALSGACDSVHRRTDSRYGALDGSPRDNRRRRAPSAALTMCAILTAWTA